jgi:hypothetical protein
MFVDKILESLNFGNCEGEKRIILKWIVGVSSSYFSSFTPPEDYYSVCDLLPFYYPFC